MEQDNYEQLLVQLEVLALAQAVKENDSPQRRHEHRSLDGLMHAKLSCPYCTSKAFVRFGRSGCTQRFRCKACYKTFTALTGTPFWRLRGKEQLLANAACMVEGLSIRKTAARLGMSVTKAFHWRRKFLTLLSQQNLAGMTGIVEVDEVLLLKSFKALRTGWASVPKSLKKSNRKLQSDDLDGVTKPEEP